VLGTGGMGVVYRVVDRRTGTTLALKTMSRTNGDMLARFKEEFRSVADLRHRNLVRLDELFESKREWFFTMEFIDGVDLLSYVRPRAGGARLDEERLRAALRQLAAALCAVHDASRVHRDVKPSNVLVAADGRVVLLDFGLSVPTVQGTQLGDVIAAGTAAYMSPEQASAQPVGPASDWYGVGVLLFEALLGRLPFDGDPLQIVRAKMAADDITLDGAAAGVPPDLAALCTELLRRDPLRRPGGGEVLRRLGADASAVAPEVLAGPSFIGQRAALEALATAFDDARGGAVLQLVVGESGEGKTALLHELVRRIADARGDVLTMVGRCHERESVSFKAFDGLVDALGRTLRRLDDADLDALLPPHAALLGLIFPSLCQVRRIGHALAAAPRIVDPSEARRRAFAAFRELLVKLAERGRLLIAIDDFHRADQDSVDLLSHLLGEPEPPRALFVLTARPSPVVDILARLARRGHLIAPRRLDLGPLDRADARELAVRLLAARGRADDAQVAALVAESSGHPGYLVELARAGVDPAAPARPRSVDELLWSRIAALPAPQRELLGLLAVGASPLPLSELGLALGLGHDALLAHADALSDVDLVTCDGRWTDSCVEPYHGRVAETILRRATPHELQRWHGLLVDALERAGGADPERILSHALAAGRTEAIGRLAAAAAARAIDALELHRAARLLRLALEHAEPGLRRRLRASLGGVLAAAGESRDAAQQFLAAVDEPRDGGDERGDEIDLRRRAADQLLLAGEVAAAVALLEDVLGRVGTPPPHGARATLARLAWARMRLRLRLVRGDRARTRPPTEDERIRLDAFWSVGQGLSTTDTLRGAEYQARFLTLALEVGDDSDRCRGLALEATYATTGGERARPRVVALIDRAARLAETSGAPLDRGWVSLARAIGGLMLGDFADARAAADDALETFTTGAVGAVWERRNARTFGILARYFLGDLADFASRTRAAMRDADVQRDRFSMSQLRAGAPNAIWLMDDDPDASAGEAEQGLRDWAPPSYQLPSYYRWVAITQAHLYAGAGARAYREVVAGWPPLEDSLLLQIDFLRADASYLRGRAAILAAAAAGADEQRALLDDAAACATALRGRGRRWSRPLARLIDAARLVRRDARAAAIQELTLAVDELGARGMAMHAAAARRGLAELTGAATWIDRADRDERDLRAAGVRRPDRWLAMFAPGFAPRV
jgi:eukaryotic-like serine/threonine-protein kinase